MPFPMILSELEGHSATASKCVFVQLCTVFFSLITTITKMTFFEYLKNGLKRKLRQKTRTK